MKKVIGIIACMLFVGALYVTNNDVVDLEAYTEVQSSGNPILTEAITVSTTPANILSGIDTYSVQYVRIYKYNADTIFLNFQTSASSTTAAATGISVFQTSENQEFIELPVNKSTSLFLSLSAASGTSEIRLAHVGK